MGKAASALAVRRWRTAPAQVAIQASWAADFGLAVNPKQIVAHRAWRVARACVMAAIDAGSGLVVVLGGPGTGKSLLLREIARQLEAGGKTVRLVQRGDLIGHPIESGVELVDEADHIGPATLERLVAARDAVHVLAALPRFAEQISGFGTPMTVVALAPLTAQGIGDFVRQRLVTAGRSADLVSDEALARLVEHSAGIPRVINMLLGAAISLAAAEAAHQVGASHVEQAVSLREGLALRPSATVTPLPIVAAPSGPAAAPDGAAAADMVKVSPPRERSISLLPAVVAAVALFGTLFTGLALHASYYPSRATIITTAANVPSEPPAAAPSAPAEPALVANWSLASAPDLEELAAIEPAAGPSSAPASTAEQTVVTPAFELAMANVRSAPVATPPSELVGHVQLPATPAVRVRIQYTRGDADTAARANRHVASLRAEGFLVDAPVQLARGVTQPGVRYFFAEDRDAAADVARRLESFAGDIRQAAPVKRDAMPRPGTVEVLLPAQ